MQKIEQDRRQLRTQIPKQLVLRGRVRWQTPRCQRVQKEPVHVDLAVALHIGGVKAGLGRLQNRRRTLPSCPRQRQRSRRHPERRDRIGIEPDFAQRQLAVLPRRIALAALFDVGTELAQKFQQQRQWWRAVG